MADAPSLDERLRAAETTISKFQGSVDTLKFWGGGGLAVAILLAVYTLGYQRSTIETHEKEIAALRAAIEQSRVELRGSLDKSDAALRTSIDRVDTRLAAWEGRGFRLAQAIVLDAEFVSVRGDQIALRMIVNGKAIAKEFTGSPEFVARANRLRPGAAVRFMESSDQPGHLAVFEPEEKSK